MRTWVIAIVTAALATGAFAQTDADLEATYEMLRGFMSVERETMIAEELRLTEAERDNFWPVYDTYRAEIEEIQDRYAVLIGQYASSYNSLTDELALRLTDEYFIIKHETLNVRESYLSKFSEIMPIQKVARFYQIENRIDNVADLALMKQIPLTDVAGPVIRGQR